MATIIYLDVDDEITTRRRPDPERARDEGRARPAAGLAPGDVADQLPAPRPRGARTQPRPVDRGRRSRGALDRGLRRAAGLHDGRRVRGRHRATTDASAGGRSAAGRRAAPGSSVRSEGASARRRGRGAAAAAGAAAASGAAAGTSSVVADAAAGAAGAGAAPPAPRPEQLTADLLAPTIDESETVVAPTPSWQPVPAVPEAPPGPPEARARSGAATIAVVPAVRRRGAPSGLALALGGVIIAVLILAAAAWLVLPQATVVLTPVAVPVGPVEFVVRADPDAATVDAAGGVIPATRLSQDFTASGQYPATGKRVVQTKAKGSVTFRTRHQQRPSRPAAVGCLDRRRVGFATNQTITAAPGADFAGAVHPSRAWGSSRSSPDRPATSAPGASTSPAAASTTSSSSSRTSQKTTGGTARGVHPGPAGRHRRRAGRPHEGPPAQFAAWVAAPARPPGRHDRLPVDGQAEHAGPVARPRQPAQRRGGDVPARRQRDRHGRRRGHEPDRPDRRAADLGQRPRRPHAPGRLGQVDPRQRPGRRRAVDFRVTANGAAIPVLDEAVLRD